MVQELSSQNLNLRKWLRGGGIDPDRDVRVVVIPSALMFEMLRSGHLDGYCVAEPWNSAAIMDGCGWTVTTTSEVEADHPEKVLLVLREFAEKREAEHLRMLAALIAASQFCALPENRPELARMLAQPCYFNVDKKLLTNSLVGPFESGHGRRSVKDFVIYDALQAGAHAGHGQMGVRPGARRWGEMTATRRCAARSSRRFSGRISSPKPCNWRRRPGDGKAFFPNDVNPKAGLKPDAQPVTLPSLNQPSDPENPLTCIPRFVPTSPNHPPEMSTALCV